MVVRSSNTRRGRTPTLEMVAAAAGVSRGTASRALNGSPNVSPRALE
jgi:DNA-binding LacI/PurR family transcriptional regulator